MNIRLASVHDIRGISRVHVESWKSTYHGIISESFLSNLTIERRIKNWERTFNNLNQDEVIYIIEDNPSIHFYKKQGGQYIHY